MFQLLLLCVISSQTVGAEIAGPGASEPTTPAALYGEGVRPTEARTPEEERAGFHVPDGFSVELVASEPEIAKPLNLAFDARGRLWVTCTVEYPYPAPADQKPRDFIRVLEDQNGDGRADRFTTFASELNIPMGLLPYSDGVITFNIPNLYHLHDRDGDGVCDERELILGPFDTTRDTHGMINSLQRGDDGWIYACHGFNNQSRVKAKDGSEIEMHSGNTFRFRADGSRIEHETHGQVNPFGMCIDRWGNRFTADCHSKPITQLLRGGFYSSFGRPDDGLGFVPSMMEHLHGSTAISGIAIYDAAGYPEAYRQQIYSGNVMTSRINRNQLQRTGATYRAKELTDFLTSDDPWFRPVDIQLGPDGALYVADFYNKIIGHYEVPLDHPGRDRERGRIWRIVYRGNESKPNDHPSRVDEKASVAQDIADLGDENITRSRLALRRLADRSDEASLQQLQSSLSNQSSSVRIGAMWALWQRNALERASLDRLMHDPSPLVRTHAIRLSRAWKSVDESLRTQWTQALTDEEPIVVREAIEALGKWGTASEVAVLLKRLQSVPTEDAILRQAIRIAIRDRFEDEAVAMKLDPEKLFGATENPDEIASVLLGVKTPIAGAWLVRYLRQLKDLGSATAYIKHAAKTVSGEDVSSFVQLLRDQSQNWETERSTLLTLLQSGTQSNIAHSPEVLAWGEQLCQQWVGELEQRLQTQELASITWTSESGKAWPMQGRKAKDGVDDQQYFSSFTLGEKYTGIMKSESFSAPASLKFWLIGHNGLPSNEDTKKNKIRLVLDSNHQTIREALPPRNDVAHQVEWDLTKWKDQSVHLECVDEDTNSAYAWIAFGRFDYRPLQPNALDAWITSGLELMTAGNFNSQRDAIYQLAGKTELGSGNQLRLLQTWGSLNNAASVQQLCNVLMPYAVSSDSYRKLYRAAESRDVSHLVVELLKPISGKLSHAEQQHLAKQLATSRESLGWLIEGVRDGYLAADLLQLKEVRVAVDAMANAEQKSLVQSIVSNLPSIDQALESLAGRLVQTVTTHPGDEKQGAAMFQKHCAQCHQLGGQGALVGPQLDGAVVRGASRLLEDILFPDRNVDRAFRTTTFLMSDGVVKSGLVRSETPNEIDLVENNGKSIKIEVSEIEERKPSQRSLMPGELHQTIGEQGLIDLVTYLVSYQPPRAAAAEAEDKPQVDKPQVDKPMGRSIRLPLKDFAKDTPRQVIVDREPGVYLGHPTTVLLEDGKTMLCVYPKGHGRGAILYKRSPDGGRTWSERIPVPENWASSLETPTIHRVIDAQGKKRLIVWSGLYPARLAVSEDDGATWSPLKDAGEWGGIVVMGSVEALKQPGHYLALFHDDGRFFSKDSKQKKPVEFTLFQSNSVDGGLTWSPPRALFTRSDVHLCEPGLIRSPDGKQLAVMLRENRRVRNSYVIFSEDEGVTWSTPRELPAALTGDRHTAKYLKDGRLFVSFRDMAHESPWRGDWVAWVGTYEDLVKGNEGALRLRVMDNKKGTDCAYPGVEVLPDGTVVTTTYGHWTEGESPYIVSVRFKPGELEAPK